MLLRWQDHFTLEKQTPSKRFSYTVKSSLKSNIPSVSDWLYRAIISMWIIKFMTISKKCKKERKSNSFNFSKSPKNWGWRCQDCTMKDTSTSQSNSQWASGTKLVNLNSFKIACVWSNFNDYQERLEQYNSAPDVSSYKFCDFSDMKKKQISLQQRHNKKFIKIELLFWFQLKHHIASYLWYFFLN